MGEPSPCAEMRAVCGSSGKRLTLMSGCSSKPTRERKLTSYAAEWDTLMRVSQLVRELAGPVSVGVQTPPPSHRAWDRCGRDRTASLGPLVGRSLGPTSPDRHRSREGPRCAPSRRGPDLDARCWGQDRSKDPARGRRRLLVPDRRAPGRLRRPRALVTRRSGSSIRGEHPPRGGNKHLKRAFFLAAFAALHDPTSRANYDRKRAEGKKDNAALICLARRRCDALYAMLRDKQPYLAPDPRRGLTSDIGTPRRGRGSFALSLVVSDGDPADSGDRPLSHGCRLA